MSRALIPTIKDPELRRFLEAKMEAIERLYNPTRLILFGSRAEGTAHAYSDIDLILVSERFEGRRFIDRMTEFGRQMAWDRHIDALCYTPEEYTRKLQAPTMLKDASESGITIV